MKKTILFLLLLLCFSLIKAQQNKPTGNDAQINFNYLGSSDNTTGLVRTFRGNIDESIRGNPYYLDYWTSGTVFLSNQYKYENLQLKYDAYHDELIYKNPKTGDSLVIKKEMTEYFTLKDMGKNKPCQFKKYAYLDEKTQTQRLGYFLVHYEGKTVLLYKAQKLLIPAANQTGAYKSGNPYDELVEGGALYLRKADEMIKFKAKEKTILEIFNDKAAELKSFIQKEKIDCKKTADLVKLLQYYDAL